MGDDEFSLRTRRAHRIRPPKTPEKLHYRSSYQFQGLSNVEIARQLLREELAQHKQKNHQRNQQPSPAWREEPTLKRKGFLKDHRAGSPRRSPLSRPSAATRPRTVIKWWCYHRQTLYCRLVLFYQLGSRRGSCASARSRGAL